MVQTNSGSAHKRKKSRDVRPFVINRNMFCAPLSAIGKYSLNGVPFPPDPMEAKARNLRYIDYYLSVLPNIMIRHALTFVINTCLLITVFGASAYAGPTLKFKTLDHPDLAAIGAIRNIIQDPQGFLWLGGLSGLARFDGYTLKIFASDRDDPTSISGSFIFDVLVDQQGHLWVGTTKGLNRYHQKQENFTRYFHHPDQANSLSNSNIAHLLQTRDGQLWVSTEGGLNRYLPDSDSFERYLHQPGNPQSLASNNIQTVHEDRQGHLWIGTANAGVTRFNPHTQQYHHYRHDPSTPDGLPGNAINVILQDAQGHLWFGSWSTGLVRFDENNDTFIPYLDTFQGKNPAGHLPVWTLYEDKDKTLWVGTNGLGLLHYDRNADRFIQHHHRSADKRSLQSDKIFAIQEDRSGNLWFSHFPSGLSLLDRYAAAFQNFQHDPDDPNSLSHSATLSMVEDKKHNLWIGTENGLNHIDRQSNTITRYLPDANDPNSLRGNAILSLLEDSQGEIWAGTWGNGINRMRAPGHFTHYLPEANNPNSLADDSVWALFEDYQHTIWAGTNTGGLHRYNPREDNFTRFQHNNQDASSLSGNRVNTLFEDHAKRLWVGTFNGLDLMEPRSGTFRHFFRGATQAGQKARSVLSDDFVWAIFEDRYHQLWVGTNGGGVNKLSYNTDSSRLHALTTYTVQDGLANNVVTGIVEDTQGHLWFSTGKGLSRLNPDTHILRTYDTQQGLAGDAFNRATGLRTHRGEVVFGSTEGLTLFKPSELFTNRAIPPVVITDFLVLNKSIKPNSPNQKILKKVITQTDHLTLNHKQSVFSFEFSALSYLMPEKNQYAYMLEGFDEHWNQVGTRRMATYTNLDPGEYVFRVKASNNEGFWNTQGTHITLHILPPWWLTWWAIVFYVAAFVALLCLVFYTFLQNKRTQDEQAVSRKLRDLDKVKDTFLANTSHELRTPLNGIIGLSESLMAGVSGPLSQSAMDNLKLIVGSGKRLSYLVNDILDFSRLKEHSIRLHRSAVDLYGLTESIFQLTHTLIDAKPITLVNDVDKYMSSIMADENRLQQILFNLIGNAIKFTEQGHVTVSAHQKGSSLWVSISDTGIGIAPDKLDQVFEAFEQAEDTRQHHAGSSGLGLAVTQQLVALHGGTIDISSTLGEGTTVRFSLSMSDNVLKEKEAYEKPHIHDPLPLPIRDTDQRFQGEGPWGEGEHHILIVDDELINRRVLQNLLGMQAYRISACSTGFRALELLRDPSKKIDLVLLDVMMPGMTGYEVCKTLRATHSVGQLPVLFLTAKSQLSDLAEGYRAGGNDFLTKPIAKEELLARMQTHLQLLNTNRQLTQKNKNIQNMLANIQQGLLSVDKDGLVHPEYSRYLESVFETKAIAGRDAMDLLFSQAKLSDESIDQVRKTLYCVIDEQELSYECNQHFLLSSYSLQYNDARKDIELDWHPVIEDGVVTLVMVSVRDVTELHHWQEEAEHQAQALNELRHLKDNSSTDKKHTT